MFITQILLEFCQNIL